jgi:hypothetical protein
MAFATDAAAVHREINMAKTGKSTKKGKPTISSPDELVKTGKKESVELTEEELNKATGGAFDAYMTHKGS